MWFTIDPFAPVQTIMLKQLEGKGFSRPSRVKHLVIIVLVLFDKTDITFDSNVSMCRERSLPAQQRSGSVKIEDGVITLGGGIDLLYLKARNRSQSAHYCGFPYLPLQPRLRTPSRPHVLSLLPVVRTTRTWGGGSI